jgi:hypothetical protein
MYIEVASGFKKFVASGQRILWTDIPPISMALAGIILAGAGQDPENGSLSVWGEEEPAQK